MSSQFKDEVHSIFKRADSIQKKLSVFRLRDDLLCRNQTIRSHGGLRVEIEAAKYISFGECWLAVGRTLCPKQTITFGDQYLITKGEVLIKAS